MPLKQSAGMRALHHRFTYDLTHSDNRYPEALRSDHFTLPQSLYQNGSFEFKTLCCGDWILFSPSATISNVRKIVPANTLVRINHPKQSIQPPRHFCEDAISD
jgi:hypothetical protein